MGREEACGKARGLLEMGEGCWRAGSAALEVFEEIEALFFAERGAVGVAAVVVAVFFGVEEELAALAAVVEPYLV